jgi:hypothetical protein
MATLAKIKESIEEIAGRRKNVTFSEIERVIGQLAAHGFTVKSRPAGDHAVIFHINDTVFSIATHRRGGKQILPCYVDEFLGAMIELGLYE